MLSPHFMRNMISMFTSALLQFNRKKYGKLNALCAQPLQGRTAH